MGIKSVIFDLDDTLIRNDGSPVNGVTQLCQRLRTWGLKIVVVSNRGGNRARSSLTSASIPHDLIVTQDETGVRKESPVFVSYPCQCLGLQPNETIYVGHSDLDMRTAVNAKVIFMNVAWAPRNSKYGIRLDTPDGIAWFISHFLMKDHLWFWSLDETDTLGRSVKIRSVIDAIGGGDNQLKRRLVNVLKKHYNPIVAGASFKLFILLHMLGSIFLDGIYLDVDYWTTYPGHERGSTNQVMASFLDIAAKLFHDRYLEELIVRHADKPKSSYIRTKGGTVPFTNETNTIHLNSSYTTRIIDKSILVIDDFTTDGHSFECARNMLFNAGAREVICISIGKYNLYHKVQVPRHDLTWDSFQPNSFVDGRDFTETSKFKIANQTAQTESKDSYNVIGQIRTP